MLISVKVSQAIERKQFLISFNVQLGIDSQTLKLFSSNIIKVYNIIIRALSMLISYIISNYNDKMPSCTGNSKNHKELSPILEMKKITKTILYYSACI